MVHTIKILAELNQWSLDDERRTVKGIIHNPTFNGQFEEGQEYIILNFKNVSRMPLFDNGEGDYILVQTQLGNYFKCYGSQMK